MSKFLTAKPNLGPQKKSPSAINSNYTGLKHPSIVKKAGKNNRSSWVLHKVIHKGKKFNPESIKTEKGKPAFQPKPKHVSYITYQLKDTKKCPDVFFCHAVYLKDGSYKPITWVQEKKLIAASHYRNNVQLTQPKSGIDMERIKAYGNRLPRVGVLAEDQLLHLVGFISDRNAIKEFEIESLSELPPRNELLFGEGGPYIPKYLNALVKGVEEENDELEVEEDEEEDEEEDDNDLEEAAEPEQKAEQQLDEDDDEGEASIHSEDEEEQEAMDVDDIDQSHSSEHQESLLPEVHSLAASGALRGGKYDQIHNVVSKTDMLARMQQLDTADSGHTLTHSGNHPNMSDASAGKRKNASDKESAPKKQKQAPAKKPAAPKAATAKKTASPPPKTKPSPKKKASAPKKSAPAKPNAAAPKAVSSNAQDEGYHTHYTTADRISEAHEKIMGIEKIRAAWTKPELAECMNAELSLNDLLKRNADETTLDVAVPFLYELMARHLDRPVPSPSKVNIGNSPSEGIRTLAEELGSCSTWTEAVSIAEKVIENANKEKKNEKLKRPLMLLIAVAMQRRDQESLTVLHSVVFTEQAKVKVGIAGEGEEQLQEYLASLKDIELQKTLFNIYLAFLKHTKEEAGEEEPEAEEFSIF